MSREATRLYIDSTPEELTQAIGLFRSQINNPEMFEYVAINTAWLNALLAIQQERARGLTPEQQSDALEKFGVK